MARIALLLLCLTCGVVDGYRIKRKSVKEGDNISAPADTAEPEDEADALMERASDATEQKTQSVMLENSVHGKSPRRRAPRRRAPAGPRFNAIGGGKCLSCGRDPRHIYKHGQGHRCQQLCASQGNCCAYSTSRFNNCLLWTQCEGLSAGGGHWGGAQCHVKQGFENVPCPTPRPTPAPSQFDVIGSGKCLSCGADPRHIYKHGQGKQCEQLCLRTGSCCAYSTSGYNNCLLWTQCEGLSAGGGHWAGAKCHVKKGFQNIPCPTTAKPTLPPTAPPTAKPTAQPTEEPTAPPTAQPTEEPTAAPTSPPTMAPTAQPTEPPCPEYAEVSDKTQKCIAYTEDWEEYEVREECCSK